MSHFLPLRITLSDKDQAVLFRRLHCKNERWRAQARQAIIEAFMRFAGKIVRQVFKDDSLVAFDEAASVAYEVLAQTAETFDPSRGVRFSTYVASRIQAALRSMRRHRLIERARDVSLEGTFTMSEENECLEDYAFGPPLPEALVCDPWERVHLAQAFRELTRCFLDLRLTKKQRLLIMDYVDTGGNFAAIARKWGVTRERVRQVWEVTAAAIRDQSKSKFKKDLAELLKS